MKRRVISLILTCALLLTLVPVLPGAGPVKAQTVAAWDGTTRVEPGKEGEVYQIGTAAELAWFAEHVNTLCEADAGLVAADAVLTADLDLGSHEWTPISRTTYVVNAYAGTFDGQGHTVSGLKIEAASANQGLFGIVNTGTVKNLRVEGAVSSTASYTGGIVGKLQTGTTGRPGARVSPDSSLKGRSAIATAPDRAKTGSADSAMPRSRTVIIWQQIPRMRSQHRGAQLLVMRRSPMPPLCCRLSMRRAAKNSLVKTKMGQTTVIRF